MTCCILIALYVQEELSFDEFHKNADKIAVIGSNTSQIYTPYPLANTLSEEVPEVEKTVRLHNIRRSTGPLRLSRDGQSYIKLNEGKYTESSFFNIFSFSLVKGNPTNALSNPNSIVLTQQSSRQLFGGEDAIGESLYWQQRDTVLILQVTGISEDVPSNSSIQFDGLISYDTMPESSRQRTTWDAYSHQTFALMQSSEALQVLSKRLATIAEMHYQSKDDSGVSDEHFFSLPFLDLHLSTLTENEGFTGNRAYLYLFSFVGIVVLIIACVNYVNLATARTSLRSKEVGVRKTMGASRAKVAVQFLGESAMISICSFILSIGIASPVLPFFNQLFGTSLHMEPIGLFWVGLFGVSVLVGILSGLYPAIYLSGFSPYAILSNHLKKESSGGVLRKGLVVFQFAIALILIIASLVIVKQLKFAQDKDLGFDGEQVVSVTISSKQAWDMRDQLKTDLSAYSGIKDVSAASTSPGTFLMRMGMEPDKLSPQEKAITEDNISFAPAFVDNNFLSLLKIKLLAGRNFSENLVTDKEQAFILNKKGAEMMGWSPEEAIGKPFNFGNKGTVVGVVENFHIRSLHDTMEPIVLFHGPSPGGILLAKLSPEGIDNSLDYLEKEIKKYAPNHAFEYEFLDARFEAMYHTEKEFAEIISLFTFIAIVIACLGLYALAAFSAERRTKEIGIRKVLGASISSIVTLLSKDFIKLVGIGFVTAVPIAWYVMNQWLMNFAYRIDIGAEIFVLAGGAALIITLLTVSWQSIKAATANPVNSLRSE